MAELLSSRVSPAGRRFCRQLAILLWKNYKIKFRAKILLLVEVLLPLLFFLALLWIRQETVPIQRPTCNYLPKGMPSIGLLPMLQSYFCTLANPCVLEALDDESTVPGDVNSSRFNNLVSALRRDLQNEDFTNSIAAILNGTAVLTETLLSLKKRTSNFEPVKVREYWRPFDLYNESQVSKHFLLDLENCYVTRRFFVDALLRSFKKENFRDDFCNASLFSEYVKFGNNSEPKTPEFQKTMCLYFPLEKVLDHVKYPFRALSLFENITGYSISLHRAIKLLQAASALASATNILANSYVWHSLLDYAAAYNEMPYDATTEKFDLVSFILCGQRLVGFDDVLQKKSRSERLRELLIRSGGTSEKKRKLWVPPKDDVVFNRSADDANGSDNFTCGSFYYGATDRECWDWLQSLEFPGMLTTQLFALFRGFILVSPSNSIVKKMIRTWHRRLDAIEDVRNLLITCFENMKNYSRIFERSRLNEGLQVLAQMYLTADSTVNITSFLAFGPFYRHLLEEIASEKWKIFPYDELAKNLSHAYNLLRCFRTYRFRTVNTETEMEEAASCLSRFRLFFSGIAFNQLSRSSVTLPSAVEYKIRMADYLIDSTSQIKDRYWNPRARDRPFIDLKYTYFGFSLLQDVLDEEIILLLTNNTARAGIYVQQFPSSCHRLDLFSKSIRRTLPMFMVLSWIFSVAMIVKCLVSEKELHLTAFMKTMGISSFVNELAWFLHFLTLLMASSAMIIFILKCGRILSYVESSFLFFFFFLYSIAIISFCFCVSSFFKKAGQAAIAAAVSYFILFLPYPAMLPYLPDLTYAQLCLSSLLPQVAFGWGCTIISSFEQAEIMLYWHEVFAPALAGDGFGLSTVLLMLAIDAVVYLMVAWSVGCDKRKRLKNGWRQVFHLVHFLRKPGKTELTKDTLERKTSGAVNYEKLSLPVGISTTNLAKDFDDRKKEEKCAVNNLSIEFYDGQIACLLGPNGAGKTTIMSIVCGLLVPSRGSVLLYGKQIAGRPSMISRSIGYCPQYNVLFDDLTVKEHLYFYAGLKAVDSHVNEGDIETILRETGLEGKANELASNLSGGMKRRLSIAIAFIGATKIVILDEPTTNVDPRSRRKIWDLLLKKREMGRTILFSTHSFDEAEILSDRIALISSGQLKCCGSPLYLKNIYHVGYSLLLQRAVGKRTSMEKLSCFVKAHVPNAFVTRASINEVQFTLPAKALEDLQPLITSIGSHLKELNCLGYGLSERNIEQIFHEETQAASPEMPTGRIEGSQQERGATPIVKQKRFAYNAFSQRKFQGRKKAYHRASAWTQFICFAEKRRLSCLRDWRTFACYVILPAIPITLTLSLRSLKYSSTSKRSSYQLSIDPMLYGSSTESFFSFSRSYSNETSDVGLKACVEMMIVHGLGKNCYLNYKDRNPELFCRNITKWDYVPAGTPLSGAALKCHCNSGSFFSCDTNEYPYFPKRYACANGLLMEDLTYLNVTNWLLMTEKEFRGRRYGGFSAAIPPEPYVDLNSTRLHNMLTLLGGVSSSFLGKMGIDAKALRPYATLPSFRMSSLQDILTDMRPKQNYKVWFNNQGWAALPSYMMALSNARLHALLPFDSFPSDFGISVVSHPMPQALEDIFQRDAVAFEMALCLAVLFSLCSSTSSVCLSLVEDRSSGMQQLLFVSGLRRWLYWTTNLLLDTILYTLTIIFIIVILFIFKQEQYVGNSSMTTAVALLFLTFGAGTIPSVYLLSRLFKSPAVAFMICALGGFLFGSVSSALTTALELLSEENQELHDISSIMKNAFQFLPQYSIMYGWNEIRIFYSLREFSPEAPGNGLLDWNNLGKPMAIMLIEGLVSLFILLVVEYHGDWCRAGLFLRCIPAFSYEEDGVAAEKENVLPMSEEQTVMLKVDNLSKRYRSYFRRPRTRTVDGVSFEVLRGECLGLLGPNGAGKTTIFKIITGEIKKFKGTVFARLERGVTGASLPPIGYCPQFDALDVRLTAKETLSLYAGIRGVNNRDRQNAVSACIHRLGLTPVVDKQVKTYSCGFKRRLSAAVGLIGDPPLLLFDEPSAGMDIKGKRLLWNTILDSVAVGGAVLFTSNNMEECEVLCNRVGILVNGKLLCLDTVQGLKDRFGHGHRLMIKLRSERNSQMDDLVSYVLTGLPGSYLLERNLNMAKFQLSRRQAALSEAIDCAVNLRSRFDVETCSLSQNSLDDIFVELTQTSQ